MRCPAWAEWQEQAIIPLRDVSTTGIVHDLLGVVDVDRMSRDDFIFEHRIDLQWLDLPVGGPPLRVSKNPSTNFTVENMPANQGFTRDMIRFEYTLELVP